MLNGPWCTLSAISLSFVRRNSDDCNEYFVWRIVKTKKWGTLRNFVWSIFDGPSGMRVQFLLWAGHLPVSRFNTVEQVILFVHFNYVTTLRFSMHVDLLRLFNACCSPSFETSTGPSSTGQAWSCEWRDGDLLILIACCRAQSSG